MSEQVLTPVQNGVIRWAAGLLLGVNVSVGDWYLEFARAAAAASIENEYALMCVDALLNQWVTAGVAGAYLAYRGLRAWFESASGA